MGLHHGYAGGEEEIFGCHQTLAAIPALQRHGALIAHHGPYGIRNGRSVAKITTQGGHVANGDGCHGFKGFEKGRIFCLHIAVSFKHRDFFGAADGQTAGKGFHALKLLDGIDVQHIVHLDWRAGF
ncbi:hypothetical protein SDC9_145337 [bioreactor metagenome]|uniref:Uncharacterized protein n=1 Tax=bioreactor metagenome TaxID=1076179 RepID=A0A645E857_9ZZZZ